jgi:hypothetical protein
MVQLELQVLTVPRDHRAFRAIPVQPVQPVLTETQVLSEPRAHPAPMELPELPVHPVQMVQPEPPDHKGMQEPPAVLRWRLSASPQGPSLTVTV